MYTKVVLSSHMGLRAPRLEGQLLRAPSAIRARHLLAVDRDGQLVPTGIVVGTSRLPWDGWLASSHHSPPLRLWHFLGGQLNVVRDRPASSASSLSLCLR